MFGLSLTARTSAAWGSLLLWSVLAILTAFLLHFSVPAALFGGLIAVGLHWISEFCHQLGHAWAAHRTGYPMIGIRFWGLLSTSIYPANEPPLPGAIHIRRALGGPTASLLLSFLAAIILLGLRTAGSIAWWCLVFFFLDNLLVLFLGAFLPLGFTDGSTIRAWWSKR